MIKEEFYTVKNISSVSKQIKEEIYLDFKLPKFPFVLDNAALLVMDMQNFFFRESSHACIPSMKAIIKNIKILEYFFKSNNRPVIYTAHFNHEENSGMMQTWWKDLIKKESDECSIISDLAAKNAVIIHKTQYDAFYKTSLKKLLLGEKIDNIVITGVMTHLCCETTARSAFVNGFKSHIVIDGTATYNKKMHVNSLYNLAHGVSVPVLAEEILENS